MILRSGRISQHRKKDMAEPATGDIQQRFDDAFQRFEVLQSRERREIAERVAELDALGRHFKS